MDALCVSNAVRFCGLANGPEGTESCVVAVTEWLQIAVSEGHGEITSSHAAQSMQANVQRLKEFGVPAPVIEMIEMIDTSDCEKLGTSEVSSKVLCAYGDALFGWHAFRILERRVAMDRTNLETEK